MLDYLSTSVNCRTAALVLLQEHVHLASDLAEHRSLNEIVLLHERPVLVHRGAVEIDRRLLVARQQRAIFDAADLVLEGAFGPGDDRWILQAFHDRSGHYLGAGKRALVGNRGGERNAGGPMVEVDVRDARRKTELHHRYFPRDVAGIIGGRPLL